MSSPVEEEAVARGRGRPKGVKDSKPRAPRGSKKAIPEARSEQAPPGGEQVDKQVDISVYAAKQPEAAPEEAPEAPEAAPEEAPEEALEAPAPEGAPEVAPLAPPPKRARTRRSPRVRRDPPKRHEETRSQIRARTPPLSYLEVMTRSLAAARVAERNEKTARYDRFFQTMR
jgi:hypothetical protein